MCRPVGRIGAAAGSQSQLGACHQHRLLLALQEGRRRLHRRFQAACVCGLGREAVRDGASVERWMVQGCRKDGGGRGAFYRV